MGKRICSYCGEKFEENNFYERENGLSTVCKDCEEVVFSRMESECGTHIALYSACASFNVPFFPLILPSAEELDEQENKWAYYNQILAESGKYTDENGTKTFFDGATNILKIFGRKLSQETTAMYIQAEMGRAGTERQRTDWGEEDGYTDEDYKALDRMYQNRVNSLKGNSIDDQMEYTLREVAKWQLLADKMRRNGEIKAATDALKTVETLLASECLRKKDEKPVEAIRPDAMVVAFEKMGLMKDGAFLSYEETAKAIMDNFVKRRKYKYSVDVCDQILLDIENSMRGNADLLPLSELSEDMLIEDEHGEFQPEETEQEKKSKRYIGAVKMRGEKKSKTKK